MELSINTFLIDTNILIDYLADALPTSGVDIIEEIIEKKLNISVITQIEFLGWHGHTELSKIAAEEIVENASIIHLTPDIISDTIYLNQQMRVKTPDAVIASSSRVHHMTLITGNDSHFRKIPGVTLYNPWNNIDSLNS